MIWKLTLGRWRFTFSMAPVTWVTGVHSKLPDGNHVLMWDFDDVELWKVREALETTQRTYSLPPIYILQTGKPNHFIAYCFRACSFRKAMEIVIYTKHTCWVFIKYAMMRNCFTLRVTPKHGRRPHITTIVQSPIKEDVFIHDLRSWVQYETLADDANTKVIDLKVL